MKFKYSDKFYKFEKGINILMPISQISPDEWLESFIEFLTLNKINYSYITGYEQVNHADKVLIVKDEQSKSVSDRIHFTKYIDTVSETMKDTIIIFITNEFDHLFHKRCINLDAPYRARTFKSYEAFSSFMKRVGLIE